ncbi:hypothetical protein FB45DRAFT_944420 [Roridomyces roridus]|uniref:Uncharacterized protein n=1 Tax=Roridomyces roridus TaxID=1738132 RepID=A0AAD7B403_9AGAR|nr:hypothetical protein FB45DRAFT_944420 [Roridomyces roridus]
MSDSELSLVRTVLFYLAVFIPTLLFLYSPSILAAIPQTATLAPLFFRATENFLHAFSAVCVVGDVVLVCIWVNDAGKWIIGRCTRSASSIDSPEAALDAGLTAPSAVSPSAKYKSIYTALGFLVTAFIAVHHLLTHNIITLDRDARQNAASVVSWLIEGWMIVLIWLVTGYGVLMGVAVVASFVKPVCRCCWTRTRERGSGVEELPVPVQQKEGKVLFEDVEA